MKEELSKSKDIKLEEKSKDNNPKEMQPLDLSMKKNQEGARQGEGIEDG